MPRRTQAPRGNHALAAQEHGPARARRAAWRSAGTGESQQAPEADYKRGRGAAQGSDAAASGGCGTLGGSAGGIAPPLLQTGRIDAFGQNERSGKRGARHSYTSPAPVYHTVHGCLPPSRDFGPHFAGICHNALKPRETMVNGAMLGLVFLNRMSHTATELHSKMWVPTAMRRDSLALRRRPW